MELSAAIRPEWAESEVPLSESMKWSAWVGSVAGEVEDTKACRAAFDTNLCAFGFNVPAMSLGVGFQLDLGGGRWREPKARNILRYIFLLPQLFPIIENVSVNSRQLRT